MAFLALGTLGFSQGGDTLTLEQVIQLAKNRNGTIQAAYLDAAASKERTRQAWAAFWPTLTPNFRYDWSRNKVNTGPFDGLSKGDESTSSVTARWRLWDSGSRDTSYRSSLRSQRSREYSALQTLRDTLFGVHAQYFDALRAQELLRVADSQVVRTREILAQTIALIENEQLPKKDKFQAEADLANAEVNRLSALNRTATSQSDLKATIGWTDADELPALQSYDEPAEFDQLPPLSEVIALGLKQRPDLAARRESIEAAKYALAQTRRDGLAIWSVDATYTKQFSRENLDNQALVFQVSIPLFDAGSSKSAVNEASYNLQSQQSSLVQSERLTRSEIESAYKVLQQDTLRVQAAKKALEASKVNFDAASKAQALGAEGTTLITVLTAQTSLVTAESNYVEAIYDYYISEIRLKLAIGEVLPGELP
ncbi:MAG: TolC family protein [Fimbriimonadaceae bacterium]|nr:TolC family protein [Fimbriimonadaceae bacterium]